MNFKFIAKIACRIMALYFFVISLQFVPNLIVNFIYFHDQMGVTDYNIYLPIAMIFPLLIASVLLWIFADSISRHIVEGAEESVEVQSADYKNAATLAFAVLGMFVLIGSTSAFITNFVQYRLLLAQGLNQSSANFNNLARIIGEVVKIIMDLWLLLGSRGIAKFITSIREFEIPRIEEPKQ